MVLPPIEQTCFTKDFKKGTKILVTGAGGFIGSHLAGRLLDQGGRIVVIDDFSTGSRDNLTQLADNPGLTIIEDDVTHCPALGQLVADSDYVFHLAAAVGVDLVVQSPIRTIETNLKSTEAILEATAPNRHIFVTQARGILVQAWSPLRVLSP